MPDDLSDSQNNAELPNQSLELAPVEEKPEAWPEDRKYSDNNVGPDGKSIFHLPELFCRTVLDHSAIKDFVKKNLSDKNSELAARMKLSAPQNLPPAKKIRQFAKQNCEAPCQSANTKGRISLCNSCQLYVYDFTDMDEEDAQAVILKQEGKEKTALFKRKDGKFLTSRCPIATKKAKQMKLAVGVLGILVVTLTALTVYSWMHPPAPQAAQRDEDDDAPAATTSAANTTMVIQETPALPTGATPSNEPKVLDTAKPIEGTNAARWKTTVKMSEGYIKMNRPNLQPTTPAQTATAASTRPTAAAQATSADKSVKSLSDSEKQVGATDNAAHPESESPGASTDSNHGIKYYGSSQ